MSSMLMLKFRRFYFLSANDFGTVPGRPAGGGGGGVNTVNVPLLCIVKSYTLYVKLRATGNCNVYEEFIKLTP